LAVKLHFCPFVERLETVDLYSLELQQKDGPLPGEFLGGVFIVTPYVPTLCIYTTLLCAHDESSHYFLRCSTLECQLGSFVQPLQLSVAASRAATYSPELVPLPSLSFMPHYRHV
jgi:hypothetical protein